MKTARHHLVRQQKPVPREGVYELYWSFASKRQAAFEARLAGQAWPWSHDPILQTYKFCNVFRAADRVSQYLIRQVAYGEDAETSRLDRVFQLTACRTFSKIATWTGLQAELGGPPRRATPAEAVRLSFSSRPNGACGRQE
ncbi:MAG: nucleotide kinase domain-containing protein [Pseudomonadota bacterium]|nr:nucleotide kinase domain-containing protein [Pseudomonadota bacterium]